MSDTIQQVRDRADILEVIGEHVVLRRTGRNYVGLCPFHGERTPSFNVNPQRGIYRCFGCGKGGDVFSFLMEHLHIGFGEALRMLADRYGVKIETMVESDERTALREAVTLAQQYFQERLQSPQAKGARDYLERRGLPSEVWERFGLGFALPEWDALYKHLKAKGLSDEVMEKAGLSKPGSHGFIDQFRGRVTFPIKSEMGKVLGFGARAMSDDGPKYLNSPETAIFQKGRILYGLDLAKSVIKEKGRALLVEGYMDVITSHLHGYKETVGVLGTALTPVQARSLLRYAQHVVVAYDSDAAGKQAAQRGIQTLEEVTRGLGLEVSILELPNKDPDEFLRAHGSEPFEQLIMQSRELSDYQIEEVLRSLGSVSTPEAKAKAVTRIIPVIRRISSPVEQDERIRSLSERLGVREESIRLEIRKVFRHNSKPALRTLPVSVKDRTTRAEEGLLYLMVEHAPTREMVAERLKDIPFHGIHQKLRQCIERHQGEQSEVSWERMLEETVGEEEHALVSALMFNEEPQGWSDIEKIGMAFLATVELSYWEEQKTLLGKALSEAITDEEKQNLVMQFQQATRRSMELNGVIKGLDSEVPVR